MENTIAVAVSLSDAVTEENKKIYVLTVTYESKSWEVKRTFQEFSVLSSSLVSEETLPVLPEEPTENETEPLQEYLAAVIALYKKNLWKTEALTNFLDDEPTKSKITQIKLSVLSSQIEQLLALNSTYETKFSEIEARSAQTELLIKDLAEKLAQRPVDKTIHTYSRRTNDSPKTPKEGDDKMDTPRQFGGEFLPKSSALYGELEENNTSNQPLEGNPDEEDFDISLLENLRNSTNAATNQLADTDGGEDFLGKWNDINPNENQLAGPGPAGEGVEAPPRAPVSGPSTKYLPKEKFPVAEQSFHYDSTIDGILESLLPHESQIQYRQSAIGLLKKQARLALNSTVYEVGLHALNCFLPTDPIKLTVVISKNQVPYWHTSLGEILKVMETGGSTNDEGQFPDIYEEHKALMNHNVQNVSFLNERDVFKVICGIDQLDVEISANARTDICMLAFLEEVAELVGQDHLFKRSLLLIRAWWVYETASYVGCPIKHYLSDFSLCIMICAIFNQFHADIHTPLQALCIFLAEYSGYDGTTHAITLHGIIPFKTPATPHVVYGNARADHLINTQFIDKYRKLFNLQASFDSDGEEIVPVPKPGSKYQQQPYYSIVNKNILNFVRFGFNVVHPFTSANMVTEKLSARRLQLIAKAFQIGAMNLSVVLKQANDNIKMAPELINSYFPAVMSKFSSHTRPDAIGNSILVPPGFDSHQYANPRDIMNISIDKIWQNILYCNFIIESIVSESAILTFFLDNLALKGPLPVGEIGKMLTEVSSIPNLSQKLKEKFGGLKRFLERFTDLFVFSNDHPFNPHVMLRNSLTAEQLELIDQGAPFPVPTPKGKFKPVGNQKSFNGDYDDEASYDGSEMAGFNNAGSNMMGAKNAAAAGNNYKYGVNGMPPAPGLGGGNQFGGMNPNAGGAGGSNKFNYGGSAGPNQMGGMMGGAGNQNPLGGGAPGMGMGGGYGGMGGIAAGGMDKKGPTVGMKTPGYAQQHNEESNMMNNRPPGMQGPGGGGVGGQQGQSKLGSFSASAPVFNPSSLPFTPSNNVIGSKVSTNQNSNKSLGLGSSSLMSNNEFLGMDDFDYPLMNPQHSGKSTGSSSILSQLRENTTELGGGNDLGGLRGNSGSSKMMQQQNLYGMDMKGMYGSGGGNNSSGGYDFSSGNNSYGGGDDYMGGMNRQQQQQFNAQKKPAGNSAPNQQQQMYHQMQQQQHHQQQQQQQNQYSNQFNNFKAYRSNM